MTPEEIDARHHFFWGGPFSQFFGCGFTLAEVSYVTAEQYMMHQKALLFEDLETAAKILAETKPSKQKALGRQVRGFNEALWDQHKEAMVRRGSDGKYRQSKSLRRRLFHTGEKLLVEASPFDLIWGIGLGEDDARKTDPAHWPGQNLLGKILTETRAVLRTDFPEEAALADAQMAKAARKAAKEPNA